MKNSNNVIYLFKYSAKLYALAFISLFSISVYSGDILINPGAGLNDLTPVTPVGGNTGTTLGEQRTIVFQAAADRWEEILQIDVDIIVDASFVSLDCTTFSGVLGAAGPLSIAFDFDNAPLASTLFVIAEALNLSGTTSTDSSIEAFFNDDVGTPGCLDSSGWYYGLDGNGPANEIDFLEVVLHELAHGLGVTNFVGQNGARPNIGGVPFNDIFMVNLRDLTLGQNWPDLTNAERAASSINDTNLVWSGTEVQRFSNVAFQGFNSGMAQMFAPTSFAQGSSVSHFDTDIFFNTTVDNITGFNELMEPERTGSFELFLTAALMSDIGWTVILDTDNDGIANVSDPFPFSALDTDSDGVGDGIDSEPNNPNICGLNVDGDNFDDCASGVNDPSADGDADADLVPDTTDTEVNNPNVCGLNVDGDDFDDCASGVNDPSADGDADADLVADGDDSEPNNSAICGLNVDGDDFDDCASGVNDPSADGDADADLVPDTTDTEVNNPNVCGLNVDGDAFDDCASGVNNPLADGDADADLVPDTTDTDDNNPNICGLNIDGDNFDDCASGVNDPLADGDADADLVPDLIDSNDNNPNICGLNVDGDAFDDCASGVNNPLADGDADADLVPDTTDTEVNNPNVCGLNVDGDAFDDCASGVNDPLADGDADADLVPDATDTDDDNPNICGLNVDGDAFDDCVSGTNDPLADGDFDADGLADTVDADDDNDGVSDADEIALNTDPLDPNDFIDETAPVVTAPGNMTFAATDSNGTSSTGLNIMILLASATAVDNVDGVYYRYY